MYYDDNTIPAISFIRVGISLTDENNYLDFKDTTMIQQKNKKKERLYYYQIIQKMFQEIKNKK
jgi:hypothetical protein